jgi:hypothetical protein
MPGMRILLNLKQWYSRQNDLSYDLVDYRGDIVKIFLDIQEKSMNVKMDSVSGERETSLNNQNQKRYSPALQIPKQKSHISKIPN